RSPAAGCRTISVALRTTGDPDERPDSARPSPLHAPPRRVAPARRRTPARTPAPGPGLGGGRGRRGDHQDLPLRRLLPDHGVRERARLHRPPRGPPPGPPGPLRPRGGPLLHARRGRAERERLHLRGQGRRPHGVRPCPSPAPIWPAPRSCCHLPVSLPPWPLPVAIAPSTPRHWSRLPSPWRATRRRPSTPWNWPATTSAARSS